MKFLIAVDGSKYTQRSLDFLAGHKELFSTAHEYTVFHGVLAVPHRAAAFVGLQMVREFYEADAEDVLRPVRGFFTEHGIAATFTHAVGHVADTIAQRAGDGGFDLVVMGSHGHGALGNLVLGSVATKVLAKCSVPVLLIR